MKTETTTTTTTAQQIRIPRSLKVDNLRHLSDHGVAVDFTDPKLRAMVQGLRDMDCGTVTLTAGKSRLTVTRLGKVTFTDAFFDVGSNHRNATHYFSPAEGLKYSLSKQEGKFSEQAHALTRAVVLGETLPRFFSPEFGAQKDTLANFLKEWGDIFTGESALRARAIALKEASARATLRSAENQFSFSQSRVADFEENCTPEFFTRRHAENRERCEKFLAHYARMREMLNGEFNAVNTPTPNPDTLRALAEKFGATRDFSSPNWNDGTRSLQFPATPETFSHPVTRANYSATVTPEGEIQLSSGIRTPFKIEAVERWLKGETPAPVTTYGVLEKIEVTTPHTFEARVLLKCGCHKIDAARDFPALAPLLTPSHTVTRVAGLPSVSLATDPAGFTARLLEKIREKIAENDSQRATTLRDFVEKKKSLENEQSNAPAHLAQLRETLATHRAELEKARGELETVKKSTPAGASVESARNIAQTLAGAFQFFTLKPSP